MVCAPVQSIIPSLKLRDYLSIQAHKPCSMLQFKHTVKILKFGTPQTIAIIVLKIEKFDVTLH